MKERVFYVINLDKQRIGVLSLFLFALFFSFFFLGVSGGKGRLESAPSKNIVSNVSEQGTTETLSAETNNKEDSIPAPTSAELSAKQTKPKETVSLGSAMEVPMADVGNNVSNPYYAETSTAKDEEEEKKAQVVELNKPTVLPKKSANKHTEFALKNQSPVKAKTPKKEVVSATQGKQLYTLQLGAFGTRDGAESFLAKVNKSKLSSKPFIVYKNGYFVVQMGKSSDKENLKKQLSKLSPDVRTKAIVVSFIPLARS